ncbi:hypothetical protein DX873_00655 [Flagellimonas nanhaiensis]|uniref:Uncharacterized protein n=1 Tax=Flagellimonas nanhaiensis TaxID=2292706 RepID=A0A371JSE5_9FLAO|nr:hypothetical protein DX873_00655 [Allomuricauda nanhaiensis]
MTKPLGPVGRIRVKTLKRGISNNFFIAFTDTESQTLLEMLKQVQHDDSQKIGTMFVTNSTKIRLKHMQPF